MTVPRSPGWRLYGADPQSTELTGKRLELLKELVPGTAPVAVLWSRASLRSWQAAEAAARERGRKLLSLEVRDAGETEGAFKTATGARARALLVFAGGRQDPQGRQARRPARRAANEVRAGAAHFTETLDFLSEEDKDWVMGRAILTRLKWS